MNLLINFFKKIIKNIKQNKFFLFNYSKYYSKNFIFIFSFSFNMSSTFMFNFNIIDLHAMIFINEIGITVNNSTTLRFIITFMMKSSSSLVFIIFDHTQYSSWIDRVTSLSKNNLRSIIGCLCIFTWLFQINHYLEIFSTLKNDLHELIFMSSSIITT